MKNTNKVCLHNFKIYFDGVETSDYVVNPDRATTQILYHAASDELSGTVAILKFTLKQKSGGENYLVLGTGTGKNQGFKLEHQAIENSIYISPNTATFEYKSIPNVLIVKTQNAGETIKISYNWKGKEFKVDSWAGIFNE